MNATLSTTAWVLHDLGLATSVGGAVFGKAGLRRAARSIDEQTGRGEIVNDAWLSFTPINLLSHLSVGATWLIGRSFLSGREVKKSTRKLVLAKDALTGVYLVSGLASTASGYGAARLRKSDRESLSSIGEDGEVTEQKRAARSRKLQRVSTALGTANLVAGAALLGITAVLAMQAGRSPKWSFVSHFLP
jgi:hypothetical protein